MRFIAVHASSDRRTVTAPTSVRVSEGSKSKGCKTATLSFKLNQLLVKCKPGQLPLAAVTRTRIKRARDGCRRQRSSDSDAQRSSDSDAQRSSDSDAPQ